MKDFQNINWEELDEKYDFTEFKNIGEYADKKEAIIMDIFSTTLNNFGVVSSEYGVIKTYDVKIKIHLNPCDIENDIYEIQQ